MKKGLLLSVVASGLIYAGGDIAPVAPVQPAAAPAACDFWGTLAARYDFNDLKPTNNQKVKFGDKENNFFALALAMGVEKQLGYGFGFGAEVGAYTNWGDIAGIPAKESAELSQLYLTYKTGNTAFKLGRQALPKAVSPWAWSDRTAGILDDAFEGLVVVNTDITNTTLVGAWINAVVKGSNRIKIAGTKNKGLFMLGLINKSIPNNTISAAAYYIPDVFGTKKKAYSLWAAIDGSVNGINYGLQGAFAKLKIAGIKNSYSIAGYIGGKISDVKVKLSAGHISYKGSPLQLSTASAIYGVGGDGLVSTASSLGDTLSGILKEKNTFARLDVSYDIPQHGTLFAGVAYNKYKDSDRAFDKRFGAKVGYKFKVAGVNAKVEYRYIKTDRTNNLPSIKQQKLRIEGVYKF